MKKTGKAILLFWTALSAMALAVEVKPDEMADAGQFMSGRFGQETYVEPVFSFLYDGKPSQELLKSWTFKKETVSQDEFREQTIITYTDPETKLEVKCVAVQWLNFPVVEWTVYLKNTSDANTPIIKDLRAIDMLLSHPEKEPVVLHYNRGDLGSRHSYAVKQAEMGIGAELKFATAGGRSTCEEWPYYNFKMSDKGVMMAIGWPGQWSSRFNRDAAGLKLNAGQELTSFVLFPGEEVRTPLIAMLFYQGDWIRGQNLWRQWMLKFNFPKDHGKILSPRLAASAAAWFEDEEYTAQLQMTFLDSYQREKIQLDYWWIDAGWYTDAVDKGWWDMTGTWEVDRKRYPNGMREVSDYARSQGIKLILWFEPERVHAGTWLAENHPEWIVSIGTKDGVLNFGHPEAWNWVVNHVDKVITEEGVGVYRQDFNLNPLRYWRQNDTEDRQGILENKHVTGYLAYWDELQRRHPGMLIDSCASGGRRNDLETMRRAVPFLQSDFEDHDAGNQCFTYGFDMWLPFHSRVAARSRVKARPLHEYKYALYGSIASPMMVWAEEIRDKNQDYSLSKKFIAMWREVADYYFGDFYPLTPYTTEESVWMAWQFNRQDMNGGVINAFRRKHCNFVSAEFRLKDLEPQAEYRLENVETKQSFTKSGAELMEKGFVVEIPGQPGAVIMKYTMVQAK